LVAAAVALGTTCDGAGAAASGYAPLDRPGPALSVPQAKLRAALHCQPGVRNAKLTPVLLNPAVGLTPEQNYS
jgi:hypothetical protein